MQEGTQMYGVPAGTAPMYMAQQGSDGHTMSFQPQTPTAGQGYPPRTPPSQGPVPPSANQVRLRFQVKIVVLYFLHISNNILKYLF